MKYSAETYDWIDLENESSIRLCAMLAWSESKGIDVLASVCVTISLQDCEPGQRIGWAERESEDLLNITVHLPWEEGKLIFQALSLGKSEMLAFVGEGLNQEGRAEITGLWMSDFDDEVFEFEDEDE
jgi:hypothetical protein